MSAATLPVMPAAVEQTAAPHWATRFLPSMRDLVFLLPVILMLRMGGIGALLGDGDTGWHVRTGEWMLRNFAIPRQDMFSFTMDGKPWFAWEWLWDLCFGWLHLHLGMQVVVMASLLVICLSASLVYRACWRKTGSFLLAFVFVFPAVAASTIHWLARPHLFSLLFTIVTYAILDRAREGRTRLLLWLPALTVLWVNLHGGFFIAWTILAAFAAGEALKNGLWPLDFHRARPYLLTLAGCVAASFLNPYGWRLHQHIWLYLNDRRQFDKISEFLSYDFHSPAAIFFVVYLLFGGVATYWHLRRGRVAEALILNCWAWLALISNRNVPIYLFLAAPIQAWAAAEMLRETDWNPAVRFHNWAASFEPLERLPRWTWLGALVLVALGALAYAPNPPAFCRTQYDVKSYPEAALPLLRSLGPDARVYADDEWGDFLIYRLYPGFKVFADGRSDFYGPAFGKDLDRLLDAKYDWQPILDRYRVNAALLRTDSAFATVVKESPRWRAVYDDGLSILFLPVSNTARPVAERKPSTPEDKTQSRGESK